MPITLKQKKRNTSSPLLQYKNEKKQLSTNNRETLTLLTPTLQAADVIEYSIVHMF